MPIISSAYSALTLFLKVEGTNGKVLFMVNGALPSIATSME
jgi:hypothetical protein